MYNAEPNRKPIRVVSHHEDFPDRVAAGFLIPDTYATKATERVKTTTLEVAALAAPNYSVVYRRSLMLGVAGLLIGLMIFETGRYVFALADSLSAAPIVVIESDSLPQPTPLHYGVQPLLSHPNFFADTHASFVSEKLTFIEADLTEMQIRYFEEGVELFSAPILSKGREGSWWETPAGLYQIELKKEDHFSSFGNVSQPWSMVFQGNFFIHGWPKEKNGTPVPEGYSGGCIRLSDEDAEALYNHVSVETPVLVHEADFENDDFVYEPKGPTLTAKQYLVADIKSNSILASTDLDAVVPIASVTKLMTALVAAEHINLDTNAYVAQGYYPTTTIPRLEGRNWSSMYSLLQLLLLESSNEAAEAIAAQVGRARFIDLMNEKALALGLEDTTFADPSGLHNGNVSTIGDLLRLVQYIHYNRSFILELTYDQDLPTAYVSGQFGELENFNLVDDDETFIGGKIGETEAAGQTSVSLHRIDIDGEDRILAFIILGSGGRNDDIHRLLDYVQDQFAD